MNRPLSKCRFCGKRVPNPYRPYHEKVLCREMKRRKGLLWLDELPKVKLREEDPVDLKQQKLLKFL